MVMIAVMVMTDVHGDDIVMIDDYGNDWCDDWWLRWWLMIMVMINVMIDDCGVIVHYGNGCRQW